MSWLFHDEMVRGVRAGQLQCDGIWSFCYCKRLNVPHSRGKPEWAGNAWACTAIDSD